MITHTPHIIDRVIEGTFVVCNYPFERNKQSDSLTVVSLGE
jgi:hypothetical protein